MSAISDFSAKVKADYEQVNIGLENIQQDVKALDAKIAELQNSPGAVTPEDQAMLDEIQNLSASLVTRTQQLADSHPEAPPVLPNQ